MEDEIAKRDNYRGAAYERASKRADIALGIANRYWQNMDYVRGGYINELKNKYIRQHPEIDKKIREGLSKAMQAKREAEKEVRQKGGSPRRQTTAGRKAYDKAMEKYVYPLEDKAKKAVDKPISRKQYTNMANGDKLREKIYGRKVDRYIGIPFSDSVERQKQADEYMARMGNKSVNGSSRSRKTPLQNAIMRDSVQRYVIASKSQGTT